MIAGDGKLAALEQRVYGVDFLARRGVDDARLARMMADVGGHEFLFVLAAPHLEVKIGTVKSRDMYGRRIQVQQANDIVLDLRRRRRGEGGDARTVRKRRDERRNSAIARTEVMAPLRKAVRLIDGDHRDGLTLQYVLEIARVETLGRDVDELDFSGCNRREPRVGFACREAAVDASRGDAL